MSEADNTPQHPTDPASVSGLPDDAVPPSAYGTGSTADGEAGFELDTGTGDESAFELDTGTGESAFELVGEPVFEPTGEPVLEPTGEVVLEPTGEPADAVVLEPDAEPVVEDDGDTSDPRMLASEQSPQRAADLIAQNNTSSEPAGGLADGETWPVEVEIGPPAGTSVDPGGATSDLAAGRPEENPLKSGAAGRRDEDQLSTEPAAAPAAASDPGTGDDAGRGKDPRRTGSESAAPAGFGGGTSAAGAAGSLAGGALGAGAAGLAGSVLGGAAGGAAGDAASGKKAADDEQAAADAAKKKKRRRFRSSKSTAAAAGPGATKKDTKEKKKDEKKAPGGEKEGGGKGKYVVALAVGLPILLPVALIFLLIMMIMATEVTANQTEVQPDDKSNAKVAQYIPKGWQEVLKAAAERTSQQPDYAIVPWTILAGLVQVQTDFGRYSPYDNVDRDPGRAVTVIGGGGNVGDGTIIGNTTGAGPGPVAGVSGEGSTASMSPSHPAPPAGNLSQQLGWYLWALRMHESNGNYNSGHPKGSDACGAYQYLTSTWNNYGGYATACDAPPSVQDRRKIEDTLRSWNKYHNWQQVIVSHFYPIWAPTPAQWGRCPNDNCSINPTVWGFVDDVIKRMQKAAQSHPATATQPAAYPMPRTPAGPVVSNASGGPGGSGGPSGPGALGTGLYADGCPVPNPSPVIGGKSGQGTGPYLLSPAAAADMRNQDLDPNNPCDSSAYAARKLSEAARRVAGDPESPKWVPDGTPKDQENARKYWSKAIGVSGIFMDRSAQPGQPCALPPEEPDKPYSVSFKIIYIWRCATNRVAELSVVTGGKYVDDKFVYTIETDRFAAAELLVNEALAVSYGAGKWKTEGCDNGKDSAQGIFPMTKQEAEAAKVTDRCDVAKNIEGAATLVLSTEQIEPAKRAHDLGVFQPMAGGWQNLHIAMGDDLKLFSAVGPGASFTASPECTKVMTRFLKAIAPQASAFAALHDPPKAAELSTWQQKLTALETASDLTDPGYTTECVIGSWAPGFNSTMAQVTADLAGTDTANAANLNGLGNFYLAAEQALEPIDPVVGQDTLVIPRLALRPLKEIDAPIAPDATDVWSKLGSNSGVSIPVEQLAIEYAWFFGGVISPFNSAGQRIGSLATATTSEGTPGTTQQTIGPDGCPTNAPQNTLRAGSDKIGIHQLCVDSVAKAGTPQAAMAIKWALSHLGWVYSMERRNEPNIADCSSFVSRAYRDSGAIPNLYRGNAPTTGTFRVVRWMKQISLSQAQPGDLVEPHSGHVAMQLADGYKVHTNTRTDVSRVERAYSSAYWVGKVVPSAV
ncbi:peptidoglycan amidohydrolase family protein [Actinomadura scrupuli]|uniref:peptidoglycan amidohydrolase family protein n=1 Tax=Actinomadura scrupuli TaxID=559629 RepID=UPI003D96FCDD